MTKLLRDYNDGKYAVLEGNLLSARKTGQVKAQLPLNESDFENDPAENGMVLIYDEVDGSVRKPADDEGSLGSSDNKTDEKVMLHFSVEKLYNVREQSLADFALPLGEFYPRLYELNKGDKFTTDAVVVADVEADLKDTLDSYVGNIVGVLNDGEFAGFIDATEEISKDDAEVAFKVIAVTDLPADDFQSKTYALKFEVV